MENFIVRFCNQTETLTTDISIYFPVGEKFNRSYGTRRGRPVNSYALVELLVEIKRSM